MAGLPIFLPTFGKLLCLFALDKHGNGNFFANRRGCPTPPVSQQCNSFVPKGNGEHIIPKHLPLVTTDEKSSMYWDTGCCLTLSHKVSLRGPETNPNLFGVRGGGREGAASGAR